MSSSNVELVRSLTDAWNQSGDPGLDAYHEDAEFDFGAWGFDFSGSFRGRDVIDRMVGEVKETWEEIKVEPGDLIDAGDKVVLSGRFSLRQRGTGLLVRDSGSLVYSLIEGKIARVELYRDHQQALEAAGMRTTARRPATRWRDPSEQKNPALAGAFPSEDGSEGREPPFPALVRDGNIANRGSSAQ